MPIKKLCGKDILTEFFIEDLINSLYFREFISLRLR
jgi:hypothetical protein